MSKDKAWEMLIENLIREGVLRSPSVIRAMRKVSREPFLPEPSRMHAAIDAPLPIGWGQTISAPHVMALP